MSAPAPLIDEASRSLFAAIVQRHRVDLVERATDWLRERSLDLGLDRPRDEAMELARCVMETQVAALLYDDDGPLNDYIEYVTTLRASLDFHVSTFIYGLLSFRECLEEVLRREVEDGWAAHAVLAAVDRVAHAAVSRAADLYTMKLNEALVRRRAQLEEDLARLTDEKRRELDEKIQTIEQQREMVNVLASPVIRVWEGVLVVPLIGELDASRADVVREKVLRMVVTTRSRIVLADVTGLSIAEERIADELLRLVSCVRLLGAEAMLVGMSPHGARALAALDVRLDEVRSFTTLHDGLGFALGRMGLKVSRR